MVQLDLPQLHDFILDLPAILSVHWVPHDLNDSLEDGKMAFMVILCPLILGNWSSDL